MSDIKTLIDSHAERLLTEKQNAARWRLVLLIAVVMLGLFVLYGSATGFATDYASIALIVAVILAFWLMRKGDEVRDLEAERLEFDHPEIFDPALPYERKPMAVGEEPDRQTVLAGQIVLRQRIRIVRDRARYAETSGVIIGSIAITFLTWFAFSLPDFLAKYHGGGYSEEWLYSYELEVVSIGLAGLVMFGWAVTRFASGRAARAEVDRLRIEIDLLPVEHSPEAARSRKLLLLNQGNLTDYYSANRFNSRATISMAILCVLAGIGITLWTILAVIDNAADEEQTKLIIAGVGAANAIMINVVAAIILRIQGTISANVNAFHDRLVRSHDIFLANVIAAEIDDDGIRRETLSAIAKSIGLRGAAETKPDKGKDDKDKKKSDPKAE